MRKTMFNKKSILHFALLLATFVLAITLPGCGASRKAPSITPNYLLSGDFVETDGYFDYYDISNNELAISLNEASKTTYNGVGNGRVISIPETHGGKNVTGIWHNAFHGNGAYEVRLTNNIKTIDFEAFLYSSIKSITIPYTVSNIGDAAFYSCSLLTSVTFVNSDQESTASATQCYCDENGEPIGSSQSGGEIHYSGLTKVPSFCFFKCSALTTVVLPAAVEEVCEEAFHGCSALNSPIYFQNIEIIRSRAFQGCTALRNVYISKSLFEDPTGPGIEPHAFNYCSYGNEVISNNLTITFCGTTEKVTQWETNHPNWGWCDDRSDPATTKNYRFTRTVQTGDTYFSADWDYKTIDGTDDVMITKYNGPVPSAATGWFISVPDRMPAPANNKVVRIDANTFNQATRQALRRLYLPKTMIAIENKMFNNNTNDTYNNNKGFRDLYVVDDNTKCVIDKGLFDNNQESQIQGRIDLSGMPELEFIGFRAFSGIGAGKKSGVAACEKIQKLRLPAKLRAIGDEAFGIFETRKLPNVDELTWDYDDANSRLEIVGTDAFYGIGMGGTGQIRGNDTWKVHYPSTIIFPRTFRWFGNLDSDKQEFRTQAGHPFEFGNDKASRPDRPAHAFAGCSLLEKVIFKGGAHDDTTNLIIPLQTFVYNESLKTIIFEERVGWYITFHTQQQESGNNPRNYAQESIGGNAGRGGNDFRSEPFLQTLVLPNKNTYLRFQSFAFHGNSRAVIYLSDEFGHNMYSDKKNHQWIKMSFENNTDLSRAEQWKTIGSEQSFTSQEAVKHYGYCFGPNNTSDYSSDKSVTTYVLDQQIPVYENVHYKADVDFKKTPSNSDDDITVEVGNGNSFEYVEDSKCAFVAGQVSGSYVATMTNYLYNLHDGGATETAHVPATVTAKFGNTNQTCTVNKIGDSAFSACYWDGADGYSFAGNDLTYIEIPDTVKSIGDYAFIRAYGVKKISAYTGNTVRNYEMPTALEHIGKNAFIFSGVEQILKIPNTCRFYENYTTYPTGVIDDGDNATGAPDIRITSTFSNAVDLRKITFLKNGSEVASSDYYETTQYTSTLTGAPIYTCAIYSKDNANLTYNKDRLLLVLNRDIADKAQPSATGTDADQVLDNSTPVGVRFKGKYKTTPYMFGAFRMGYWIKELECGNPTLSDPSDATSVIPQPLFSVVGTRGSNSATLTKKVLYLGIADYGYENLYCTLDTIAGNVLILPQHAMNGCEELENVEFPIQANGKIPDGVFANVTNADTKYYVENDTPVAHTLDLTNSQYVEIGNRTFMSNPSIQSFKAPNVASFTIGQSAFETCANLTTVDFTEVDTNLTIKSSAFYNCDNLTTVNFGSLNGDLKIQSNAFKDCAKLTTINFSNITGNITIDAGAFQACGNSGITLNFANVTGTLTINGGGDSGAFQSSKVASITWPSSGAIKINTSAFRDCDSLTAVTIPSNVNVDLGSTAFYDCDSLTTVTFSSGFSKKIGNSSFESCDSLTTVTVDNGTSPVTTIGEAAFQNCSALNAFDFDKFTSLTTINKQAFQNAGELMANGNVVLPATVTKIGSDAFRNSGIVTMTIQTSTEIDLDSKCFADCSSLRAVRFTNPSCGWIDYGDGIFNNCPDLTELQLPTGFEIDMANDSDHYNGTSKFFIQGDEDINLYTYTKYINGSTTASSGWRTWSAGLEISLNYFVEDINDLLAAGVINNPSGITSLASSVSFWTTDQDGHAINLGTVTGYTGTVVTFSGGYTLDGSGFHAGA